jgi:hypothetical protein
VPATFVFVGKEEVDGAGEDAEAGLGGDDTEELAVVFDFVAGVPDCLEVFELVLELVSREGLRESLLLVDLEIGFGGEALGNPVAGAADDLADAGLGDFVFFGEAAGGEVFDLIEAVDFEVAGRGRKGLVAGG